MVILRKFRFYFIFYVSVVLSTFDLLLFIDVWFVIILSTVGLSSFYQHDVVRRLVIMFYPYRDDSRKLVIFDHQYVEKLEL